VSNFVIDKHKIGKYPEKDWIFCELSIFEIIKECRYVKDTSKILMFFKTAIISMT